MTEAEQYMRRAIELAEKGRHRVMPNPLVGCVLVRDEEIVAEGWHDHLGGLHAARPPPEMRNMHRVFPKQPRVDEPITL